MRVNYFKLLYSYLKKNTSEWPIFIIIVTQIVEIKTNRRAHQIVKVTLPLPPIPPDIRRVMLFQMKHRKRKSDRRRRTTKGSSESALWGSLLITILWKQPPSRLRNSSWGERSLKKTTVSLETARQADIGWQTSRWRHKVPVKGRFGCAAHHPHGTARPVWRVQLAGTAKNTDR